MTAPTADGPVIVAPGTLALRYPPSCVCCDADVETQLVLTIVRANVSWGWTAALSLPLLVMGKPPRIIHDETQYRWRFPCCRICAAHAWWTDAQQWSAAVGATTGMLGVVALWVFVFARAWSLELGVVAVVCGAVAGLLLGTLFVRWQFMRYTATCRARGFPVTGWWEGDRVFFQVPRKSWGERFAALNECDPAPRT